MPNANILARTVYGDSIFESMQRASGHRCSLDPVEVCFCLIFFSFIIISFSFHERSVFFALLILE